MELIYTGLKPSIPQEEPAGAGERRQKNGIEKKIKVGIKRGRGAKVNSVTIIVCANTPYMKLQT